MRDTIIDGEIVAGAKQERQVGFRVDNNSSTKQEEPIKPTTPPTFHPSGYFDDGYDLTVALYCLYDYGRLEAGDELLSNPKLKEKYDNSPYKRNELKLNQIPSLVKKPLKEAGLILSRQGHRDVAEYNLDEVLTELGLLEYGAELTRLQSIQKEKILQKEKMPILDLDSLRSHAEVCHFLGKKIAKIYDTISFVTLEQSRYQPNQPVISVFFKDTEDGDAITFFGSNPDNYNKPISDKLLSRVDNVFKIIKPYLVKQNG